MVTREQRSAAPSGGPDEARPGPVRRRTVLRVPGAGKAAAPADAARADGREAAAGTGAGAGVHGDTGGDQATVTLPRQRLRPSPRRRAMPATDSEEPVEAFDIPDLRPAATTVTASAVTSTGVAVKAGADVEAGAAVEAGEDVGTAGADEAEVGLPPDEAAADGAAADGAAGDGAARRPGDPRRTRLLAGALVVLLVAALVAAGLLLRQWHDQRETDSARDAAVASARQVTVNFVSISASTVDRDLQRIASGATGQFKDEFTQDTAQVRAAVVANKVDSHGTVLRAAVVSADRHSAVVLVAVDATVKNTSAPDGRLSHYRIQVNLSRDPASGHWLVAQLQFVG